ncbi:MAG: hypothetical protein ACYCOR_07240 [Acidobacteriaceae bacterium]
MDNDKKAVQSTLLLPFVGLVAMYCGWILSLPLFPAQDSPMHLYIASVLSSLLSGSNHFSTYFYVRHLLTPYSFHYYFLIFFGRLFSFPIADKLLVCAIIVCSAFGFRYLALTVGPSGDVMSLFAIPLFLSWALGMGFYNYCLSLGLAFWALAFWSRAVSYRRHRMWICFLCAVTLMGLTHPLPVVLVVAFVVLHVVWRKLQASSRCPTKLRGLHSGFAQFGWEIFYAAAASTIFLYIASFGSSGLSAKPIYRAYDPAAALAAIARAQYISLFAGTTIATRLDRLSLYAMLVLSITLACQGFRERCKCQSSSFGDILLTCGVLLILAVTLLPPNIHAVDAFSTRLITVVWLTMLAASSGHSRFAPRLRFALAAVACLYGVALLSMADVRIRPVAKTIAAVETLPIIAGKRVGLGSELPYRPVGKELAFDPYYWTAARYFRRTRSTMLNSGWTYQNYIMLGSRSSAISSGLTPEIMGTPRMLEDMLLQSPAEQGRILPRSDLLVFLGYTKQPQEMLADVRAIDRQEPQRAWNCSDEDWYFVCTAPEVEVSQ